MLENYLLTISMITFRLKMGFKNIIISHEVTFSSAISCFSYNTHACLTNHGTYIRGNSEIVAPIMNNLCGCYNSAVAAVEGEIGECQEAESDM